MVRWYNEAYSLYRWFSKYEHYGYISKVMLDNDADLEYNRFLKSTFYIFHASYISLSIMGVNDKKIKEMKELSDNLFKLPPI